MSQFVRFENNSMSCHGIIEGQKIRRISAPPFELWQKQDDTFSLLDVKLLPPCLPSKIVAVGLNYKDHAEELGMPIPAEPILFIKPPTTLCGHKDPIIYPPSSTQVDYEAELAIVIGRLTKDIEPADAPDHILGYTCLNDVTARDLQKRDGQWTRAKSFDTFCPVGPWIETDIDPQRCEVECYLNGELKQHSSTENQIFPPCFLVSFISKIMTLAPGDVIATGTPPGVGPMKVGDKVEIHIKGIGRLTNHVTEYI